MWIRTECGKLFSEWITIDKERNEVIWTNGAYYNIKKQGDNLIDVLEAKDQLFIDNNLLVVGYIDDYNLAMHCVYGEIIYCQTRRKLQEYIDNAEIVKVLTHEQYMPLAQEVTNETN